ncbi:permease [Bifidobacterium lemurum]|uniref:Permease n=1 Tax=Bifidobacterium lemurum TaxID=1603886 RepID=A0A261FPD5_9BIFI|nr:AEC family transporter [Bifidobacterium lemurum]OZG60958.1 permease [Bifidobacterium lemurum]QOL34756.1 permease [Bifidobacterium lemurum]
MSAIIQPASLLLIILAGYLFKRFGLFGQRDYRVLQTAEFNIVLPGAIIYSFATNPHDISLLWIAAFSFLCALIPLLFIFAATRKRKVSDRAFLMLNGAGFNLGCFCFPVVQAFWGAGAVVPAAMFDIGNCVMVAAGTNVMTQQLLHIQPGKTLAEQHAGDAPTLPYEKPKDRDARRLTRHAMARNIAHSFFGSVPFDTYLLMIALMIADVRIPEWIATICQPLSNANAFVAMFMVGMLMDLPSSRHDVRELLEVIAWRLPFGLLFAAAAWFVLPFDAATRAVAVICCLAPIAIFSTLFTDKVLGNARLAGFSLAITAIISLVMMTVARMFLPI